MPRVREITDGGGDKILVAELSSEREIFGDILNPTRVLAHCPGDLAGGEKALCINRPIGAFTAHITDAGVRAGRGT